MLNRDRAGQRVRLVFTDDEYTDLKPGDEGVIQGQTDGAYPQLHVRWDNGSNLSLIPHVDRYEVLT